MMQTSEQKKHQQLASMIQRATQQMDAAVTEQNWHKVSKIGFDINQLLTFIYKNKAYVKNFHRDLNLLKYCLQKAQQDMVTKSERLSHKIANFQSNKDGLRAYQEAIALWQ